MCPLDTVKWGVSRSDTLFLDLGGESTSSNGFAYLEIDQTFQQDEISMESRRRFPEVIRNSVPKLARDLCY